MAVSTFKYAESTDLQRIYSKVSNFDTKNPIYNWVEVTGSTQYASKNCGLVTQLYIDGEELGDKVSSICAVSSNGKWYYDSGTDTVYYFHSSNDPNDKLMEAGTDFATLIDDVLENASQELNTLLDARYPVPIPKAFMYADNTDGSDTPQYDPIIVRATCYLASANLIRSTDPMSEEADKFYSFITNEEGTGLIDEINAGKRKLNFEIDATDKSGNVIEVTNTGSMYLVETYGNYSGKFFDRIQCICTTLGVYGTAKISVKTFGEDKLYGTETTGVVITGDLQLITGGLYARWEGNSMAVDDRWDIEVRNSGLTDTNAPIKNIRIRRGYGRAYNK